MIETPFHPSEEEVRDCLAKCYALILATSAKIEKNAAIDGETLSGSPSVAEIPAQQSEATAK